MKAVPLSEQSFADFGCCANSHYSGHGPATIEMFQVGIPFKRAPQHTIDYLEREEIDSILKAINRTTTQGSRDYALLATMFNRRLLPAPGKKLNASPRGDEPAFYSALSLSTEWSSGSQNRIEPTYSPDPRASILESR